MHFEWRDSEPCGTGGAALDSGIPSAFEQLKPFLKDGTKKAIEQAIVVLSCDDTSDRQKGARGKGGERNV
jgi:hypothetical protein